MLVKLQNTPKLETSNRTNNGMAVTGFILGLASIFLYFIGILPIFAVVFGGLGLTTFNSQTHKNKWMAVVGLALGVIYTIAMLNYYGHLK